MTAYYNEIDPFSAAWLRELISAGHIADGIVDERSIEDVTPNDLSGFDKFHFFAGIGGWSYALRLAGWPDDRPVWSGSCPCQPFSSAGKGKGFADERHLWPAWYWLIEQCRPSIVFGEQVASKATGSWFDLIQADLEALDYAFGIVPFPAAGIGAPHIRDRAYWVAYATSARCDRKEQTPEGNSWDKARLLLSGTECRNGMLAYASGTGLEERQEQHARSERQTTERGCNVERLADSDSTGPQQRHEATQAARYGNTPNADGSRHATGPTNGHWRDADWIFCRDGKWRPVMPGSTPLANGVPNRVGKLRGYGNAIVPHQAAIFIKSCME